MKSKILTALVLCGVTTLASAFDGTITFTGEVTSNTCTISGNGGSNNFTVTLPRVSATALNTAPEHVAGRTAFNIALTACNPTGGNVRTYFEPGPTVNLGTGRLTTAVTNVEIGLLNADFSNIKIGAADGSTPGTTQNSQTVPISGTGTATLPYFAEYNALAGAAGTGPVNTSVRYTLIYP
ncbi:fimbrial protein [Comamonas sp. GB3 AK4-5]|uniref:fimbrial protein n=1 Tax=Comamonas sp. GB3 AK4-5 TaxID=3231487 RepID=UPI00351E412A